MAKTIGEVKVRQNEEKIVLFSGLIREEKVLVFFLYKEVENHRQICAFFSEQKKIKRSDRIEGNIFFSTRNVSSTIYIIYLTPLNRPIMMIN